MTDLQRRLDVIRETANQVSAMCKTTQNVSPADIISLCYCIDYLAQILKMHLKSSEN